MAEPGSPSRTVDRRTVFKAVAGGAVVAAGGTTAFALANGSPAVAPRTNPTELAQPPRDTRSEMTPGEVDVDEGGGYERIGEGDRRIDVSDGDQLADALSVAEPGHRIVLADGDYTYAGGFVLRGVRGSASRGVTVEAANTGAAVFVGAAGVLVDDCAHVVIRGIRHRGELTGPDHEKHAFTIADSDHVRITRCYLEMDNSTGDEIRDNDYVFIDGTSRRNRVDHCRFGPKSTIGTFIYIKADDDLEQVCQLTTVDHNHFAGLTGEANSNYEPVRMGHGEAGRSSAFTLFEHNLMTDCVADDEFVSVKSSDNVIRYNTFRRMFGALVLRVGSRNDVYANFWFGDGETRSGGITVNDGTGHRIWNNYLADLGSEESNRPGGVIFEVLDSADAQVTDSVLAFNSILNCPRPVIIGRDRSEPEYRFQPDSITVADNLLLPSASFAAIEQASEDGAARFDGNVVAPSEGSNAGRDSGVAVVDAQLSEQGELLAPDIGTDLAADAAPRLGFVEHDATGRQRPPRPTVGAVEPVDDGDDPRAWPIAPLTPDDVGPESA